MNNFIDTLQLFLFAALAITLGLWAWLKRNTIPVERTEKFGCILKNDCIRIGSCKWDGKKRCVMRRWKRAPRIVFAIWVLFFPAVIVLGVVGFILNPLHPIQAIQRSVVSWWRFCPTKDEMALPVKDGIAP